MDRVTTVKDEALSKSYEDNTTLLTSEYTKIALYLIGKYVDASVQEALSEFPEYKVNKHFLEHFPSILKREKKKKDYKWVSNQLKRCK